MEMFMYSFEPINFPAVKADKISSLNSVNKRINIEYGMNITKNNLAILPLFLSTEAFKISGSKAWFKEM